MASGSTTSAAKAAISSSLIARERNVRLTDALAIASELLGEGAPRPLMRPRVTAQNSDDAALLVKWALRLWQETTPLYGSLGERYLVEHRRFPVTDRPLDHALRWHDRIKALVALMTDPRRESQSASIALFSTTTGRSESGRCSVVRASCVCPRTRLSASV